MYYSRTGDGGRLLAVQEQSIRSRVNCAVKRGDEVDNGKDNRRAVENHSVRSKVGHSSSSSSYGGHQPWSNKTAKSNEPFSVSYRQRSGGGWPRSNVLTEDALTACDDDADDDSFDDVSVYDYANMSVDEEDKKRIEFPNNILNCPND